MGTALLDVALIVKNEEENLPGCLEAIAGLGSLVSRVCAYDSGSTDRTVEIAREWGVVVQRGYWDNDFARARNAAIAMCTAKWVLILDADERVKANPKILGPYLRRALSEGMTGVDAIDVAVTNVMNGKAGESWPSRRLLRPGKAHYVGAVHEQVFPIHEGRVLSSLDPGRSVIEIEHHGYSSMERVKEKTRRNEQLAQAEIDRIGDSSDENELLIRALVDRARSMLGRGETDDALADLQRVRRMSSTFNYRWWGMEQLADALVSFGDLAEARAVIDDLAREGSGQAYRDWLTARLLMAAGDIEGGMRLLRELDVLSSAIGMVVKPRLLQEARMRGAIALGEFDEALACLVAMMSAGEGTEFAGVLLRLWGDRPAPVLAELFSGSDRGHLPVIAESFEGRSPAGDAVAKILRGAHAVAG